MSIRELYSNNMWEVLYHDNKNYKVNITIIDKNTSQQQSLTTIYDENDEEISKDSTIYLDIFNYCFNSGGMK